MRNEKTATKKKSKIFLISLCAVCLAVAAAAVGAGLAGFSPEGLALTSFNRNTVSMKDRDADNNRGGEVDSSEWEPEDSSVNDKQGNSNYLFESEAENQAAVQNPGKEQQNNEPDGGDSNGAVIVEDPNGNGTIDSGNPGEGILPGEGEGTGEGAEGEGGTGTGPSEGGDGGGDSPGGTKEPHNSINLPKDIYEGGGIVEPIIIPAEGIKDETGKLVDFVVETSDFDNRDYSGFLRGSEITTSDFFYHAYFYAMVKGTDGGITAYRITQACPNFKVGVYPETVPDGEFKVTFSFRLHSKARWTSRTLTFRTYDAAVYIKAKDRVSNLDVRYFNIGEIINLKLFNELIYEQEFGSEWYISEIDAVFPGWTDSSGSSTDWGYTIDRGGVHRLYQMPMVKADDDFTVKIGFHLEDDIFICEPEITAYDGAERDVRIPEGIYRVKSLLPSGGTGEIEIDTLTISKDVKLIDLTGVTVVREFRVEPGNSAFCTENGVLYNYDKTEEIARPTQGADDGSE